MSEVMRWKLKGFIPGVEGVSKALFQPWVVPAADFDRVTAERDALQVLLTAADERVDVLEGLLREVVGSCALIFQDHDATAETMDLHERAESALKHASARASVKLRSDGTLSNDIPAGQSGHIAIGNLDYGSLDAAQRLALCRGEQPAPVATVLPERSPKDYAIEHAEYMAKSADNVLAKFQAYGLALLAVDEGGDDGEGELFENIDSARDDLQESLVDLRSMVYEFRKRSAKS